MCTTKKLLIALMLTGIASGSIAAAGASALEVLSMSEAHSLVGPTSLPIEAFLRASIDSGSAHAGPTLSGPGNLELDDYFSMHKQALSTEAGPIVMHWPYLRAYTNFESRLTTDKQLGCNPYDRFSDNAREGSSLRLSAIQGRSAT